MGAGRQHSPSAAAPRYPIVLSLPGLPTQVPSRRRGAALRRPGFRGSVFWTSGLPPAPPRVPAFPARGAAAISPKPIASTTKAERKAGARAERGGRGPEPEEGPGAQIPVSPTLRLGAPSGNRSRIAVATSLNTKERVTFYRQFLFFRAV